MLSWCYCASVFILLEIYLKSAGIILSSAISVRLKTIPAFSWAGISFTLQFFPECRPIPLKITGFIKVVWKILFTIEVIYKKAQTLKTTNVSKNNKNAS